MSIPVPERKAERETWSLFYQPLLGIGKNYISQESLGADIDLVPTLWPRVMGIVLLL